MTQVNSNTTTLFVSTRRAIQPHVRALIESHSGKFGPGGYVGLECRRDAVHELVRRLKAQPKRRPQRPPDGLRTASEAAAKLGCSIKTLNGHVEWCTPLRHHRPRHQAPAQDVQRRRSRRLHRAQTRKDVPCPSTAISARRTGNSISGGEVIAFRQYQGHDPARSRSNRARRSARRRRCTLRADRRRGRRCGSTMWPGAAG